MLSLTCQGISALGLFYIDIILKTLKVQELITHTPPQVRLKINLQFALSSPKQDDKHTAVSSRLLDQNNI